jgi:hypothetical protein
LPLLQGDGIEEENMIETAYFKKCPAAARRRILAAIEKLDIRELKIDRTIIPIYVEPDPRPSHYFTGEMTYTIRGYSRSRFRGSIKAASTRVKKTRRTP